MTKLRGKKRSQERRSFMSVHQSGFNILKTDFYFIFFSCSDSTKHFSPSLL